MGAMRRMAGRGLLAEARIMSRRFGLASAATTGIVITTAGLAGTAGAVAPGYAVGAVRAAQLSARHHAVLSQESRAGAGAGRAPGPAASAGTVSTIAGGVGGPASARRVSVNLCGLALARDGCGVSFAGGHVYFTDLETAGISVGRDDNGGLVRAVSLRTGRLTTPVGVGQQGLAGDGGPAAKAQTEELDDVAVDGSGNLLVADGGRVRVAAAASGTFYGQAMKAGDIYTVAGGGSSTQDGVPATAAAIDTVAVLVDHAGNIVIAGRAVLRVVAARTGTLYGRAMTAGDIYTVAGGGSSTQDGVPATSAAMTPLGVAVDAAGNLLVADPAAGRVRVVAVSTGRFYGQAMTAGDVYTAAGGGTSGGDGVPARTAALAPYGVAVDRAGNLVVADIAGRARVVAARTGRFYGQAMTAGDIYTVAGGGTSTRNGGLATSAMLGQPRAVAVDSAGNIVIAARHTRLLRVVAARTGTFYGVRMLARHLYVIAGNGQVWSSGTGGLAIRAQFIPDRAVTFDRGNLAVSSCKPAHPFCGSTTVRLVAARSGVFFGQAMTAGNLYRIAGNGKARFSGMGGPARKAGLRSVSSMAADGHGNLVIADFGNDRILVVAARAGRFYGRSMRAGHIYLIAGDGSPQSSGNGGPARKAGLEPSAVCIDHNGNVVLGAVLGSQVKIRVVAEHTGTFYGIKMTAGDIYNIAGSLQGIRGDGGPARDARFEQIDALVPDGSRGLLISDPYRIRMIAAATGTFFGVPMKAGDIYTVAGTGKPGPSADGTPALAADIWPSALTTDSAGNLIFYDASVNKIRVIAARTGTFYGVPMTAHHLYSIVGGGTGGPGDGGPGTQATINGIIRLAAHRHRLAFTDAGDRRVRMIVR